jgi:uncharacterized protein (DUF849 family)
VAPDYNIAKEDLAWLRNRQAELGVEQTLEEFTDELRDLLAKYLDRGMVIENRPGFASRKRERSQ